MSPTQDQQHGISEEAETLDTLSAQYTRNEFRRQIQNLPYCQWRRVRGDGNCFYRAFCWIVLNEAAYDTRIAIALRNRINRLTPSVVESAFQSAGFDEMIIGMWTAVYHSLYHNPKLNILMHVLCDEIRSKLSKQQAVTQFLMEPSFAHYTILLARIITAVKLIAKGSEYVWFITSAPGRIEDDPAAIMRWYIREMTIKYGQEAEHLHIVALVEYLLQQCSNEEETEPLFILPIFTVDGKGAEPTVLMLPEEAIRHKNNSIKDVANWRYALLYRPGHYDVLEDPREKPSIE